MAVGRERGARAGAHGRARTGWARTRTTLA
jgi:hypothetical protein